MIRLSIPRIALVLSLLIPVAGLCADDDVSWIADKSGCKVANPFPQPGESIAWKGQCKNGVADGEGLRHSLWTEADGQSEKARRNSPFC